MPQLLLMTRLFGERASPDSLAIVALPYRSLVAEKRALLRRLLQGASCTCGRKPVAQVHKLKVLVLARARRCYATC